MKKILVAITSFIALGAASFLYSPAPFVYASSATTTYFGDYVRSESFADTYFVDRNTSGNLVRRSFMNEQVFFTWQTNFDNVITITDAALASLPLGPLMLPQSGVVLVKIQSVNKVYAIDGGELRWITSEKTAIDIYGSRWADYVIDLPPTMFPYFDQGATIEDTADAPTPAVMKSRVSLVSTVTTATGPTSSPVASVSMPAAATHNPFASATFYVDPHSSARQQVTEWSAVRWTDSLALEKIAAQPTARWFGDWNSDITSAVDTYVTTVTATGALPILVAYNIPDRDCGNYSAGGSDTDNDYRSWIAGFAAGIGSRNAVVILEPDATATSCVTNERLALMGEAVTMFKAQPNTAVYIDAGHDNWIDAVTMAERLTIANIAQADGFALNVSNFYTTEENTRYGSAVSVLIDDKHFIIDTSRNGQGWNGEWCNPSERSIGVAPTANTGNVLVDALLWVKPPGESDGTCNGGPSAGTWWADYALGLVQ